MAGIVTAYKTKSTRAGTLMAYATVEDDTSSIELLCFAKVLERCGRFLAVGSAVVVQGRLSVRDEKPPQILCDNVTPLGGEGELPPPDALPQPTAKAGVQVLEGGTLWIRLGNAKDPLLRHVNRVINMFPGETPARLVFADTGKRLGTRCLLAKSLVDELVAVLGRENVVIR